MARNKILIEELVPYVFHEGGTYTWRLRFARNGVSGYIANVRFINFGHEGKGDDLETLIIANETYSNYLGKKNNLIIESAKEAIFACVSETIMKDIETIKLKECQVPKVDFKVCNVKMADSSETQYDITLRSEKNDIEFSVELWRLFGQINRWVLSIDSKTEKAITSLFEAPYSAWRKDLFAILENDERLRYPMLF